MRVAIAADWLTAFGGAEHVVAALHRAWPQAPVVTTVASSSRIPGLQSATLKTDPLLQIAYRILGRHQFLLPWMPSAVERMDARGCDVVVSSSHAVGKGIIPPATAVHICYCHTPMRYAWEMEAEYLRDFRIRWPVKKYVRRELKRLRRWDISTSKRVDRFIANSSETKERIQRIYGRDSIVIPPPVEERFFESALHPRPSNLEPRTYLLAIGRLVPYKRFDLLIQLAAAVGMPLKIAGRGTDMERLRSLAGPTVEFLGYVPDADLPGLYTQAACLLFPQIEDAGIVPLEALASGLPVLALGRGGVLDVIRDGTNGILVPEQSVPAFRQAFDRFRTMTWNREAIRESAKPFGANRFVERMRKEVNDAWENHRMRSVGGS